MSSTVREFRAIKRGDVSSVLPMIAKFAHDAHRKLPPHTQGWRTTEDLIQEGIAFTATKVVKQYNPKNTSQANFQTYLFRSLHNYYFNRVEHEHRGERQEFTTFSYSTDTVRGNDSGYCSPLHEHLIKKYRYTSLESDIIQKIDAEKAFIRVYAAATMQLRKYLISWLLQPTEYKFKRGAAYRVAAKEFRQLSKRFEFTYELGKFIMATEECRRDIAHTILFKKAFFTYKRISNHGWLSETVEGSLLPIVSKSRS